MTLLEIINQIVPSLKSQLHINALWLEGSWATGRNNDQSDIDVWMDVDDESFDESIESFREALKSVGEIDWEKSRGVYSNEPRLQKHTFHLAGFPEPQCIELDLQQHSRQFKFDKNENIIKVLFDKGDIIQWR